MNRTRKTVAWVLGLGLVVLHHDFWWEGPRGTFAGAFPVEPAWRVAWMALAFGYLLWLTAVLGRSSDEEGA